MASPEVCVLKTDGINCDVEMAHAFETAGGKPETVHVNQLRSGEKRLGDFAILALSGGFSYGDDVASGRILANELTSFLSDELRVFNEAERPVLGVCNGFQVLVKSGLLPYGTIGEQYMTLTDNTTGRFECRWIDLLVRESVCRYVQPEDFAELPLPMQTAHGEGRFFGPGLPILDLGSEGQVVFQYCRADLSIAQGSFPENPNGSELDIAGICDPTGTILGMMPHPERSIAAFHPHRARTEIAQQAATAIFTNIVDYARSL